MEEHTMNFLENLKHKLAGEKKRDYELTWWDAIKYRYWTILPYDYRPGQLWYQLRCFFWNRYSTVKPRWLGHTWIDRGDLMPYVMFEILCQFIEHECDPGCVEWYGEYGHKIIPGKPFVHPDEESPDAVYVMDELLALRDWWVNDYLVNHDHCYDKWHEHRQLYYKDADFMEVLNSKQTPEEKALFNEAVEAEAKYDRDLIVNMQRLAVLTPFMWT
jgi:hypothetical protein